MKSARKKWTLITLAWTGLIFFSSTSTAGSACERFYQFVVDHFLPSIEQMATADSLAHLLAEKGAHFALFCTLGFLLAHLVRGDTGIRLAKIMVFGLVIGSASELLQTLFPGRDPALRDVVLNFASATIGGLATLAWWRGKRRDNLAA